MISQVLSICSAKMNSSKTFTLFLVLFFAFTADSNADNSTILESPTITDRGDWGELASCSSNPDKLVIGFQLRVDYRDPFNEDNTGLNGIWLACGDPHIRDQTEDELVRQTEWITSSNASYGQFQQRLFCSSDGGYAIGFQLKSQQDQGPLVDDVGAVNLKMICADEEEIEGYNEKTNIYPDADYTERIQCPQDFGVCGIQTQVEDIKWTGDNTALNNIRIKCCEVPKQPALISTTTEVDDAAVIVISGKEEGPLPQLIRLFENQKGRGVNETISITSGQCNPIPEAWIGRVGALEYKADCVRIWETSNCSGRTRCHCDEGFLSLDETLPMSKNVSNWKGRVNGLSMCPVENEEFSSFRMFSETSFKGESEYTVLIPRQCLTFYEGDKWRGNVASMIIVDGCVEIFDQEECSGKLLNSLLANDFDTTAEVRGYKSVKSVRNCALAGESRFSLSDNM